MSGGMGGGYGMCGGYGTSGRPFIPWTGRWRKPWSCPLGWHSARYRCPSPERGGSRDLGHAPCGGAAHCTAIHLLNGATVVAETFAVPPAVARRTVPPFQAEATAVRPAVSLVVARNAVTRVHLLDGAAVEASVVPLAVARYTLPPPISGVEAGLRRSDGGAVDCCDRAAAGDNQKRR
jgi:hypothetical protein